MAVTQTDMANGAPVILAAADDQLDDNMYIRVAVWAGCTAITHALLISDYDSTVTLYEGTGAVSVDKFLRGLSGTRLRNGLKVTTMGSGKLLLYP